MKIRHVAVVVICALMAGCSYLREQRQPDESDDKAQTEVIEKAKQQQAPIAPEQGEASQEPIQKKEDNETIQDPSKVDQKQTKLLITFDDFPCQRESRLAEQTKINRKILQILRKHSVHTVVFANASMMRSLEVHSELLREWIRNGHLIGNHTYSHMKLSSSDPLDFKTDIIKGEPILKKVLAEFGQELRYFRYPYLDHSTGETKTQIETFLKNRGYEIVDSTIDSLDWFYNARLHNNDATAYLNHVKTQLTESYGRSEYEIIIFHVNYINSENFEKIIEHATNLGYKII